MGGAQGLWLIDHIAVGRIQGLTSIQWVGFRV